MYRRIDEYTEYKYSKSIEKLIEEKQKTLDFYDIIVGDTDIKTCIKRAKKINYSPIKLIVRKYFPNLTYAIRLLRERIK